MNQGTFPLLVFDSQCSQVIDQVRQLLTGSGFWVVESFDFQVARAGHSGCTCPHHGTGQCDCQMAVLLVYGRTGSPITLIIHGNEDTTDLSIVDIPGQIADPGMKKKIAHAIEPQYFVFCAPEPASNPA